MEWLFVLWHKIQYSILSLVNFTLCFPVVHHTYSDGRFRSCQNTLAHHSLTICFPLNLAGCKLNLKIGIMPNWNSQVSSSHEANTEAHDFQATRASNDSSRPRHLLCLWWIMKVSTVVALIVKKNGNIQRIRCFTGRLNVRGEGAFLCSRVTVTFWEHCVKIYNGKPAVVFLRSVRLLQKNAAALNLSSGCQIFIFFLPPRVHWWIFQQVVNKPGWLLESRRLQLTHRCFCSFASRRGATREPF